MKAERELIDEAARSSGLAESDWSGLLASVDERHRAALELASRMLQARGDFYRALQRMLAVVIDQFGKYKVGADGQIQLSSKVATDRMVAAAEQVSAADKALERIEEQMMKARQAPQQTLEPAWKDMIINERTGTPQ